MVTVKSNTVSVTARLDIKSLAICASFLHKQGEFLTTKSDLIWRIMEIFKNSIVGKGIVALPETIEDAVCMLEEIGISMAGNERQRRQLSRAMQEQTGVADFGCSPLRKQVTKSQPSREDRYQALCMLRADQDLPVMDRNDFYKMEARQRANGYMDRENPAQAYITPEAPADINQQVQMATARTMQERHALASVHPPVVSTKPASEQGEPTAPASTISNDGN
ncbi:MAG: hypothetical protein WC455_21310 [Dehalococcoidia bacterium]